uniref:YncE family protein n=1 Tax=Stappia sp. TaxID=1870903 RepID=UPI003BAA13AC
MTFLGRFLDRLLGRGDWSITLPVLDGPLLPNQALEEAETFATLEAADNLVASGKHLYASSGNCLHRYPESGGPGEVVEDYGRRVCALAGAKDMLAVGIDGCGVVIRGGPHDGRSFSEAEGRSFGAVTALAFFDADTLLMANGSGEVGAGEWRRDLMRKGSSGSIWKLDLRTGAVQNLADGLAWPAGIAVTGSSIVYLSEAWRHRILSLDIATGELRPVLEHLPAYPARIAPAYNAGYWLSFYSIRNQLVEFILREDGFRTRMLEEVPEPFWMAPSLASGQDFREPMQGSQLKQMGVLKPYATTRSYGLVVACNARMQPYASFHSRADGSAHGTVSACEMGDDLMVASRGGGRILRLSAVAGGKSG